MTLFITTLNGDVVLEAPAVSEYLIVPVGIESRRTCFSSKTIAFCIPSVVTIVNKLSFGHVTQVLVILDVILSTEEFRLLTEALASGLEGIRNSCLALRTVLGGDQYNTITSLSTIDSCRSTVLQHLDRLDE